MMIFLSSDRRYPNAPKPEVLRHQQDEDDQENDQENYRETYFVLPAAPWASTGGEKRERERKGKHKQAGALPSGVQVQLVLVVRQEAHGPGDRGPVNLTPEVQLLLRYNAHELGVPKSHEPVHLLGCW